MKASTKIWLAIAGILLIALGGRASLNAGAKPFVSVKCQNGSDPVETLKRIFRVK